VSIVADGRWITIRLKSRRLVDRSMFVVRQWESPVGWRRLSTWPAALPDGWCQQNGEVGDVVEWAKALQCE